MPSEPTETQVGRDSVEALMVMLAGRPVAIPARAVLSILPRPNLIPAPAGPASLAGLMDLRGSLVPVVDGSVLLGGPPTPFQLGARVVLIEVGMASRDDPMQIARFGLLCERVHRRTILSTGNDAWHPGAGAGPRALVPMIGRADREIMPLLDPSAIVAQIPLLRSPVVARTSLPMDGAPP